MSAVFRATTSGRAGWRRHTVRAAPGTYAYGPPRHRVGPAHPTGGTAEATWLGTWLAPNLTADTSSGIGKLSDGQIAVGGGEDSVVRVVEPTTTAEVIPLTSDDDAAMFDPAEDKIYRHPTFYNIPDDVKHI